MEDYYNILGLDPSADMVQIRAAYKRMAMQYHPDHNPGDVQAEETFKKINEAYHTLSDALKKSRYDSRFHPGDISINPEVFDAYEEKRRKYWRMQQAKQWTYKIDKEYFKIQGLAFLVFIIIAGFCFAIIHTAYYFLEQKRLAKWREDTQAINQVNALFIQGKFDDAFGEMSALKKNNPLEFRFIITYDSLMNELHELAEQEFNANNFSDAIRYFFILQHYETPARYETLLRIVQCQYYLGNFKEALQVMKSLHDQRPEDLQLIYQIGLINLEQLDNVDEALQYFDLGKQLFKKNFSEAYGEAFMLVMNPANVPDIYFEIFYARAKTNLKLKRYKDVLSDCTWSIYLRPDKGESYRLRALANLQEGNAREVCTDLKMARNLGDQESTTLFKKHCK